MVKTVLIFGISGCVGHSLAKELLSDGFNIIGIYRNNKSLEKIKDISNKVRLIRLDDIDKNFASLANDNIDVCVNCIGDTYYGTNKEKIKLQTFSNVGLTKKIIDITEDLDIQKYIHISTAACYIDNPSRYGNYIKSKIDAETYVRISNIDNWIILRPSIILGEYDYNNYTKIFKLIKDNRLSHALPGFANVCYAKNVARAVISCFSENLRKLVLLLNDDSISYNLLFELIASSIGINKKFKEVSILSLKIYSIYEYIKSFFTNNDPVISKNLIDILSIKESKYKKELEALTKSYIKYPYYSVRAEDMIQEQGRWLTNENLI